MREQLEHLVTVSGQPNITVQILPLTAGAHAAAVGSFVILGRATPELDVVYVDIIDGVVACSWRSRRNSNAISWRSSTCAHKHWISSLLPRS
ncbi:Scr1 family TA system antitoxin-like transcriptional regulator [Streptomyces sp. NPDC092903]|uniref:Scr1 family TA system antitoxin-like transcriptional regulator n=1 Tax=Streptomyces sp. NPDC092903 TaxID=3366017 RepID=UPI0038244DF3